MAQTEMMQLLNHCKQHLILMDKYLKRSIARQISLHADLEITVQKTR